MTFRRRSYAWLWPALGGLALAGAMAARHYRRTDIAVADLPSPATTTASLPDSRAELDAISAQAAQQLRLRLTESGWRTGAAEQVAELNREFLGMLAAEDPGQLEKMADALSKLGRHSGLMSLLEQRPEVAGLLAAAPDPVEVAARLRDDKHYNAITNIFVRHAADSAQVAEAIERHETLICQLIDDGMLGAESMFVFPRGSAGAAAYDRWLAHAFGSVLANDEQLPGMFQLVMVHGTALRRWMIDDEDFRRDFLPVVWPRLERLIDEGVLSLELATLDLRLFRLLGEPAGEQLVRRWGLLPLELLYGDTYPPELRPALVETMLAGDNTTLASLLEFGDQPLLATLLGREDLAPEVKASALGRLHAAGSDYPELLRRYSELKSPAALADEVGPLPSGPITWLPLYYTVYEVPKKIIQGRNPTMMDAVIAVLDPVFLFAGPLGPDDAIKVAGQQGVKAAGSKTATNTAAQGLKAAARREAARQLGANAAKLGAEETAPWLVSQALRGSRQAVQRKLQSSLTVDVTGPTRLLFKMTGVGRQTFRQMTKLEARVFMRPDRRVLIRLDRLLVAHPAGRFLADTAIAGLVETGVEIPAIENAAVGVAQGIEAFPDQINQAKSRFSAWQKNVSAWWLAQASGLWDDEIGENP